MFSSAALAQLELRVNIEVRDCGELPQPEVRRVLAAELSAQLADQRAPDVTRIVIECRGDRAVLRVGDPLSRKVVQRTIDLGASDAPARGRLVALATAELVVASWTELETNPTPKVEPAGPRPPAGAAAAARKVARQRTAPKPTPPAQEAAPLPPSERPPPAPPRPPGSDSPYDERWPDPQNWGIDDPSPDRGFRVVGVVSTRAFFAHDGVLWGGGLRVGEERFKTVGWTLDALAESGEIDSGSRLQVDTATIGGGINLYLRVPSLVARLGAGIRMGFARTQALDNPETVNASFAPWGWPLASAGLTLRVRQAVLEVSGEGSYVVLPVAGAPAVEGGWFGIQVGVGVVP